MPVRVLLFIIPLLLCASYCFGNEAERFVLENLNLETERKVARTQNIYLVFNLREKTIHIKAKGVILKEIEILDSSYWGSILPGELLTLHKKRVFMKPRRDKIKPGESKDDHVIELDALEVKDMPSRYKLMFDRGVNISIKPEGLLSTIGTFLPSTKNLIIRPVITVWYRVWQKAYTRVEITLDEQAAKVLYWSFLEGMQAILYPP